MVAIAIGVILASGSTSAGPPPRLVLHAFELRARPLLETRPVHRRVQIAVPEGWTVVGPPGEPELELVGPEGVGRMLVFAGLQPSDLGPVLDRLRAAHPSAAPSPPEKLDLPGLRPELGERATRFVITGREVGEMALIERHDTIVLVVTVVEPNAWTELAPKLLRVYPTVTISDLPSSGHGASAPR